jgi:hypothetical protein
MLGYAVPSAEPGKPPVSCRASIVELFSPHTLVVNRAGRRFADESFFQGIVPSLRQFDTLKHEHPNVPCYLIFDQQYLTQFSFGNQPVGSPVPDAIPRADNLPDLAKKIGVDADAFVVTIERFNDFARSGVDQDFHRGELKWPARTPAETNAISKLSVLQQCTTAIDDRTACNVFLGRALQLLFGNTDFKTDGGGFMLANDIASGLENTAASMGWSKIGMATDQAALNNAQTAANAGKAVVAARKGRVDNAGVTHAGHVVLIIPGTAQRYDFDDTVNGHAVAFRWGTLVTPNSASFFLDRPDKFFIGCPLSATWQAPDGVGLYSKP